MKKYLLIGLILTPLVVLSALLVFRQTRSAEMRDRVVVAGVRLGVSLSEDVILDYSVHSSMLYAKLALTEERYLELRHRFISDPGTAASEGITVQNASEQPSNLLDREYFDSALSRLSRTKLRYELHSMCLNDYEELFFLSTVYAIQTFFSGTTGSMYYALIKENSGNCYLYVIG